VEKSLLLGKPLAVEVPERHAALDSPGGGVLHFFQREERRYGTVQSRADDGQVGRAAVRWLRKQKLQKEGAAVSGQQPDGAVGSASGAGVYRAGERWYPAAVLVEPATAGSARRADHHR